MKGELKIQKKDKIKKIKINNNKVTKYLEDFLKDNKIIKLHAKTLFLKEKIFIIIIII